MSTSQRPEPTPATAAYVAPTLSERLTKKLAAARDIVDPPTPVRLLVDGVMLAAVV